MKKYIKNLLIITIGMLVAYSVFFFLSVLGVAIWYAI